MFSNPPFLSFSEGGVYTSLLPVAIVVCHLLCFLVGFFSHTLTHFVCNFCLLFLDLSLRFGFCSSNNNHHERTDRSLRSLASRLARRNQRSCLIGHRTADWDRLPLRRHCNQWWRRTIGCSPVSIRFDTGCRTFQCCNRNDWRHTPFRWRSPSRPLSRCRTYSGRTRWHRSHFGLHWSYRSHRYWPFRVRRTGPCWPAGDCAPDSLRDRPSRAEHCRTKRVPEHYDVAACSSVARIDSVVPNHNGLVSVPEDHYRAFHHA